MPESQYPVPLPHEDLETEPLKLGAEDISDSLALDLVTRSFNEYETYRTNNGDSRWLRNDALYFGTRPQKSWPGTNIPRASLAQPIVFDAIEAAVPVVTQALFGSGEFFDVEAGYGSTPQQARAVKNHFSYVFQNARGLASYGATTERELTLAIKSIFQYGNGGTTLEWDMLENVPHISWVDMRDIYIDSSVTTPNIDEASSVIRRKTMSVGELSAYRNIQGMKIPADEVLYGLANTRTIAIADNTKTQSEALRRNNYVPGVTDWQINPADRAIEVLVYYSKTRIIWVANREVVLYNAINPYGYIPFCFAPCYIVLGRFHAQSIIDVNADNQLYIEGLLNGHLDEVSLNLHPPRVGPRDAMLSPTAQRWFPGSYITMDDPKALQVLSPGNVTQNVFQEIQYITQAAQKRVGIDGTGSPTSGNISRTATGVEAQTSGATSRIQQIVKHIEDYLLVPLLYKMYRMIQVHTMPGQMLNSRDGNEIGQVDAANFTADSMTFKMLAASKMMTQAKLAQIVPFLVQNLFTGQAQQGLAQSNQKVDWNEFFSMMQDAAGTMKKYQLIIPMSEDDIKKRDSAAQMQQQQSQQALQAKAQETQQKSQTAIQIAQISHPPPAPDPAKQQETQLKMQAALLKSQADLALTAAKTQAATDQAAVNLQASQAKIQLDAQAAAQKQQASEESHRLELQHQQEQAQLDIQKSLALHATSMEQTSEVNKEKLSMMRQQTKLQTAVVREKAQKMTKAKPPQ